MFWGAEVSLCIHAGHSNSSSNQEQSSTDKKSTGIHEMDDVCIRVGHDEVLFLLIEERDL